MFAAFMMLLTIGLGGCGNHEPEGSTARNPPRPQLIEAPVPQAGSPEGDTPPSPVQSQAWFTEITNPAGLAMTHHAGIEGEFHVEEIMGPGCGLFDYDGDGRLDIYVFHGRTDTMDRLYRQLADGTFADVTESCGIRGKGYGMGCAVGDFDNDGDVDLYVTNFGPDQLWRNNGDGTFTDVTTEAGVDNGFWSVAASFFDYDRDGRLDLYVINYVLDPHSATCFGPVGRPEYCGPQNFTPAADRLFHNEGGGRFRDVSAESGIATVSGPGLGVVCADFNRDGLADMYVANDGKANFLWLNRGDGTFDESAMMLGCAVNRNGIAEAGMGIALGDVDHNGWADLFVTHLINETNTLYRGETGGIFVEATDMSGLGASSFPYTGFGTVMVDFDHDGDLDLLVANGAVKRRPRAAPGLAVAEHLRLYAEPNLLYLNDGSGRFENVSPQAGEICSRAEVSRGLAVGDIDGDGDLDVLMAQDDGPVRLFRNDMPKAGRWLIVRAFDPTLNRDALGAEVIVEAGGRRHVRTVMTSFSYGTSCPPTTHFGLGAVDRLDRVTVRWPGGDVERFGGVPIDATVELRRGSGEPVQASAGPGP